VETGETGCADLSLADNFKALYESGIAARLLLLLLLLLFSLSP